MRCAMAARPTEEAETMFKAAGSMFNTALSALPLNSTDPIVNALRKQLTGQTALAMGLESLAVALRQVYDKR